MDRRKQASAVAAALLEGEGSGRRSLAKARRGASWSRGEWQLVVVLAFVIGLAGFGAGLLYGASRGSLFLIAEFSAWAGMLVASFAVCWRRASARGPQRRRARSDARSGRQIS